MPVGTSGVGYLLTSGVLGTAGVFAQTTITPESNILERLGTAGLLVMGAVFLVRYFIAELAKKDTYIERITKEHTEMLVSELKTAAASREQIALALRELTDHIRRNS